MGTAAGELAEGEALTQQEGATTADEPVCFSLSLVLFSYKKTVSVVQDLLTFVALSDFQFRMPAVAVFLAILAAEVPHTHRWKGKGA